MDFRNWEKKFCSTSWNSEGTEGYIQSLLNAGFDINALDESGETMLSYAAEYGKLKIAEFLVKEGADANIANSDGSKPLHIAAKHGRKDIMKFFLKKGISADSCDKEKSTPLHYVAGASYIPSADRASYQDLVSILVEDHKANIDALNEKGFAPVTIAAQNSQKHLVELFIKLGANVESNFYLGFDFSYLDYDYDPKGNHYATLLHYACRRGWLDVVKSLVSKGCDINAKDSSGRTPLICALHGPGSSVVKYLIECGADVDVHNKYGQIVFLYACGEGWLDVVKSLVSKGCDINAKDPIGKTPLFMAVHQFHSSVAKYLIERGAEVKVCNKDIEYGRQVLNYACRMGWLDVVKSAVCKECLNAENRQGKTPLMLAVEGSHLSVVQYLIERGADVNKYKCTVLLSDVCREGWLDVVKWLVSKGCDINAKDRHGLTVLHNAVYGYHPSVVEYLLQSGADVNEDGCTVLNVACRKGWLDVVKCLVSKGCDINAKDFYGKTPLKNAVNGSHPSVIKYLLESGVVEERERGIVLVNSIKL